MGAPDGLTVIHQGGNLVVFEDSTLAPTRPEGLRMTFAWREKPCEATLSERGLLLSAKLGRVPSTATDPDARSRLIAALRSGSLPVPKGCGLHLGKDHSLRVVNMTSPRAPTDMVTLLAALVRFSLHMDPLIDEMEAIGLD